MEALNEIDNYKTNNALRETISMVECRISPHHLTTKTQKHGRMRKANNKELNTWTVIWYE
jgi:hypothetical protein